MLLVGLNILMGYSGCLVFDLQWAPGSGKNCGIVNFIRQSVEDGDIHPRYVCSEDQLTDILTKALPRPRFEELRVKLVCVL
jgi:hypothetical protein